MPKKVEMCNACVLFNVPGMVWRGATVDFVNCVKKDVDVSSFPFVEFRQEYAL